MEEFIFHIKEKIEIKEFEAFILHSLNTKDINFVKLKAHDKFNKYLQEYNLNFNELQIKYKGYLYDFSNFDVAAFREILFKRQQNYQEVLKMMELGSVEERGLFVDVVSLCEDAEVLLKNQCLNCIEFAAKNLKSCQLHSFSFNLTTFGNSAHVYLKNNKTKNIKKTS